MRLTPARCRGAATTFLLLSAGCAERGLVSRPASSPSALTWGAVAVAATAATVVIGATLVLPGRRFGGSAFAMWLLAGQAGAVVVGSGILVGAAVRSEQLVTGPPDAEQAASLLRLTGLDGRDTGFFRLVVLLTVLLGILLVVVLALGARFAGGVDFRERTVACALLALEAGLSGVAVVLVVLGDHSQPVVLAAAALPVLFAGAFTAWPPPIPPPDPPAAFLPGKP